jgi:hypothetical protein
MVLEIWSSGDRLITDALICDADDLRSAVEQKQYSTVAHLIRKHTPTHAADEVYRYALEVVNTSASLDEGLERMSPEAHLFALDIFFMCEFRVHWARCCCWTSRVEQWIDEDVVNHLGILSLVYHPEAVHVVAPLVAVNLRTFVASISNECVSELLFAYVDVVHADHKEAKMVLLKSAMVRGSVPFSHMVLHHMQRLRCNLEEHGLLYDIVMSFTSLPRRRDTATEWKRLLYRLLQEHMSTDLHVCTIVYDILRHLLLRNLDVYSEPYVVALVRLVQTHMPHRPLLRSDIHRTSAVWKDVKDTLERCYENGDALVLPGGGTCTVTQVEVWHVKNLTLRTRAPHPFLWVVPRRQTED